MEGPHFWVLNKLRSPGLRLELFGLKTPELEVGDGIGAGLGRTEEDRRIFSP